MSDSKSFLETKKEEEEPIEDEAQTLKRNCCASFPLQLQVKGCPMLVRHKKTLLPAVLGIEEEEEEEEPIEDKNHFIFRHRINLEVMLMASPDTWVAVHECFGSLLDTSSHISSNVNPPSDDIPKTVARTLHQDSSPMSMDFHPLQQSLLLVGTNVGDIALWEVASRKLLVSRNFQVWGRSACAKPFQALIRDPRVSVNRVIWSPDGALFGVAYSRQIVQTYSYRGGDQILQCLELDAHVGGVNDVAFLHLDKQLCMITCGDDETIKVWDPHRGVKLFTLEGHESPVYSVCPHVTKDIQIIFSTALDGKIKAWLYDNLGLHNHVDYEAEAPGWCTTMACSADGTRLFSCGTSKDGESCIVELNASEGIVKRTYKGFCKRSLGVVQFDAAKNRLLAAGDDFSIKFWDMDNVQLLTTVDADGVLPARPRIRFNKDGTLLAVSANENEIKILANEDGIRLLHTLENSLYDTSRASESLAKLTINPISGAAAAATSAALAERASIMNGDTQNLGDVKPGISEESNDKSKIWKLTEIKKPSQCRSFKLPENVGVTKISRLTYTNSGNAILALASNAIHLLWKWQRNEHNSSGKAAAATLQLELWQPSGDILMTNVFGDSLYAASCFALSKNDNYVMSASGGKISLFDMRTFTTITTFMPPPPAATCLAFHPQDNNIIAIGMDDYTIQICNVCVDEVTELSVRRKGLLQVKSKLRGHTERITGLAFSHVLNVLVSCGADDQICVWNTDGWEKQDYRFLLFPPGRRPLLCSDKDTHVQFHQDQIQFLVVHETHLCIFEATELQALNLWYVKDNNSLAPISHATFSCDCQLVYASFLDGTICVFRAEDLSLRCQINPSAYLPANVSSSNKALVIAAHPKEPNQFAVGLSDEGIHVFEPLESEGRWGVPPPMWDGSKIIHFS